MEFDIALLEHLPVAVFTFKDMMDFTVLQANQLFYDLIGYDKEEFSRRFGNRMSTIGYVEDLAAINMLITSATSKEEMLHAEGRIKKSNGNVVRLALHFGPLEEGYICVAGNLTKYTNQSSEIREINAQLASILEHSEMDAFSCDFSTGQVFWHLGKLLSFPTKEGVHPFKYFVQEKILLEEDAIRIRAFFGDFSDIPKAFALEARVFIKDTYHWCHLNFIKENLDKKAASENIYLCIVTDVSDKKVADRKQLVEGRFFREVLKTQDAYAKIDVTDNHVVLLGGIWIIYEGLRKKKGYSEIITKYANKVTHPLDRDAYAESTTIENYKKKYDKGVRFLTCKFRRKDGNNTMHWMQLLVHLFKDEENGHLMAIMSLISIGLPEKIEKKVTIEGFDDLESARKQFDTYLAQNDESVCLIDPETYTFICGNSAFYNRFKVNPEDCYGMRCHTVLYGKDKPCIFCKKERCDGNEPYYWSVWNPVVEENHLIKSQCVYFGERRLLLDVTMGAPEALLEKRSSSIECSLLSYVEIIGQMEERDAILRKTAEYLSEYYEAEYICLCEKKKQKWVFDFKWNKPETLGITYTHPTILPNEIQDCFKIESAEEIRESMPEKYSHLKAYNIYNVFVMPLKNKDENIQQCLYMTNFHGNFKNREFFRNICEFLSAELKKRDLLEEYAHHDQYDTLTDLLNRRSFDRYLRQYNADDVRNIAIINTDINGMKAINESRGQMAGDAHIVSFAELIKKVFKPGDCKETQIFRLSGDEFMVIMENTELEVFLERVKIFKATIDAAEHLSISMGYTWEEVERELDPLIKQAANLLYINKQQYYDKEQIEKNNRHYTLLKETIKSIEDGEFEVYYQPKIDIKTKEIIGAEALIRYNDPEHGIQPPGRFLPELEDNHLIRYIDLFVFEKVCDTINKLREEGWVPVPISLNFSRLTLIESGIIESVEFLIKKYMTDKDLIEIEITETIGEINKSIVSNVVNGLKRSGFKILLDDFGTKYTNLSILTEIHSDELKIDRGLINTISNSETNQIVIKNIIAMCKDLGKIVTAEGIEDEDQEVILQKLGCDKGQGYLYGKPMPKSDFEKLLMKK